MALKEHYVTIDEEGRDKGKLFYILEMPAEPATWWAIRALIAIGKAKAADPSQFYLSLGMETMARQGFLALFQANPEDLKLLLDELMARVRIVPDPKYKASHRQLTEGDIEEVSTNIRLYREVFDIHTGFSSPAGR
jgi:hypothetical protein